MLGQQSEIVADWGKLPISVLPLTLAQTAKCAIGWPTRPSVQFEMRRLSVMGYLDRKCRSHTRLPLCHAMAIATLFLGVDSKLITNRPLVMPK